MALKESERRTYPAVGSYMIVWVNSEDDGIVGTMYGGPSLFETVASAQEAIDSFHSEYPEYQCTIVQLVSVAGKAN